MAKGSETMTSESEREPMSEALHGRVVRRSRYLRRIGVREKPHRACFFFRGFFVLRSGHRSSFGASSSWSTIARLRSRGRRFRERATMSSFGFSVGCGVLLFFPRTEATWPFKMAFFLKLFIKQLCDLYDL